MPRKGSVVDGPRTFSGLTGAWTASHRRSMSCKERAQLVDIGGPARKRSSR